MSKYAEMAHALAKDIATDDRDIGERLGEMTICASVFIGAAGAIMAEISRRKSGPDLDVAGWSREVANMVVATMEKERH
jgi:hypothetical protein